MHRHKEHRSEAPDCTCDAYPLPHRASWHGSLPASNKRCLICHMPNGVHKMDCPNRG